VSKQQYCGTHVAIAAGAVVQNSNRVGMGSVMSDGTGGKKGRLRMTGCKSRTPAAVGKDSELGSLYGKQSTSPAWTDNAP